MIEERLMLLLLPGMDGSGELFADFIPLLPGWIEPRVVNYPHDQKLSYDQLLLILNSAAPSDRAYVVLAESFSTPLAVKFAGQHPEGLQALVLCAGFVMPPRRGLLAHVGRIIAPMLFSLGLPRSVCRYFLTGENAPMAVVNEVRATVSKVSGKVLAHRLMSVLSCNGERDLRRITIPLLYILGRDDRLVRSSSFGEIRHARPDASLATVDAPHLILQVKPREVADVVVPFLRNVRGGSSE